MSSAFTPLRAVHIPHNMDYNPYSPPESPLPDDAALLHPRRRRRPNFPALLNAVPEDDNASLRSQALNADGTPKRPMNAFMIFARRRRPQVSAANQMMRTGEISKILSREWNTMGMAEKQFYLDQAKKLKENFNQKYPDYVYRRRPNNSRKKRRIDAAPYDPTVASHVHGTYDTQHDDFGSVSPIEPHPHSQHGIVQHPDMLAQPYRLPTGGPSTTIYPTSAAVAAAAAAAGSSSFHPDSYPYYHRHLPPVLDAPAPTLSLSTASFSSNHHHHHHGSNSAGGSHHGHGSSSAQLYNDHHDDHLWHPTSASSSASFPSLKPDPWTHHSSSHPHTNTHHIHPFADPTSTALPPPTNQLRLSARRGAGPLQPLHAPSLSLPAPLQSLHLPHSAHGGAHSAPPTATHARHWSGSDGTTAATTTGASVSSGSPPSSAGSGGFPPGFGSGTGTGAGAGAGAGAGFASHSPSTGGFQTLTAPFYPGAGAGAGSGGGSVSGESGSGSGGGGGGGGGSSGGSSGTTTGGLSLGLGLGLGLGSAHAAPGSLSPSTASASSACSSYFSGARSVSGGSGSMVDERERPGGRGRGEEGRYSERVYGGSQSQSHHSTRGSGAGATLGSTLALSPANVQQHASAWSGATRTAREL